MAWQIKIGSAALAEPSVYGVESIVVEYASLAPDVATLSGSSAILSAEYGDTVEIWNGGIRRFVGRVRTVPLSGAFDRTVQVYGAWGDLERVVFCQRWKFPAVGGGLEWKESTRAILGQDEAGEAQSVGAQIADVVAYAASRGVSIQIGTCSIPLVLPLDEVRDLTCAQAISRMLRMTPSVCSWFNYATTPPTLNFGQSSSISPSRIEDSVSTIRNDLVISGLRLEIERNNDVNGVSYRTLEVLTAGEWEDIGACWASLQLAGLRSTRNIVKVNVTTEDIPANLTAASWWCARHPRLAGLDPEDVVISAAERGANPGSYPRISLTPIETLEPLSVSARVETFFATADVIKRDAADEVVSVEKGVELEMQLVTTSASTRTYRYLQSFSATSPESTPDGLAAALYAHWSILYAEGSAQWPLADLWANPGMLLHSTPIQRVIVDSTASTCSAIYGPPQQLSASDLAGILSRFRSRRSSTRYEARTTGQTAAPAEDTRATTGIARTTGHAPGAPARTKIVAAVGEISHAIDLHPACIAFADEEHEAAQTLQPRELRVIIDDEGTLKAKLVQVLASEPYGDAEAVGGGSALDDGTATGQIVYWNHTAGEWAVATVGTLAPGDVLTWDGSKYVRKALTSLIRFDTGSDQLQVLVGSTWTMIPGGQAVEFVLPEG